MAQVHCQLLFSTILYCLVFLSSLVVISTIAYAKGHADGCYLFLKKDVSERHVLPCSMTLYSSGAASAYAVIMAIYHGYGTIVASRDSHIGRTMWVMPWLLSNSLLLFLTFVCACVYSIGLHISCSQFPNDAKSKYRCSIESGAYLAATIAEIAGWISVLLWGCLIGIEGVRLARNRRAISREVYVDPTTSDVVNIGNILPTA